MTLSLLASMIVAGIVGAISHELAHWLVWRVSGRCPKLDLWNLVVYPRSGPRSSTQVDKIAAAAPYAIGLLALLYAWASSSVVVLMFGLGIIGIPSMADIATMRGATEWDMKY